MPTTLDVRAIEPDVDTLSLNEPIKVPEGITLIVSCAHCKNSIVSTKGLTKQDKFVSLIENVNGHMLKRHRELAEQNKIILRECIGALTIINWADDINLDNQTTEHRILTRWVIEEEIERCENLLYPSDEEDESEEDGEDDTLPIEGEVAGEETIESRGKIEPV